MKKVATGIFTWDAFARQSKQYGHFTVEQKGYSADAVADYCFFDEGLLYEHEGRRVKFTAVVLEARPSGHCGDMFLFRPGEAEHLKPIEPAVGEVVEIGVGKLSLRRGSGLDNLMMGLAPADGREHFWLDPEILYRLHDQTVNIFIEDTTAPDSPVTKLMWEQDQNKLKAVGDGFFQLNTPVCEDDKVRIKPKMRRVSRDTFIMEFPHAKGEDGEIFIER